MHHHACHCCGLIHAIPELAVGDRAVCVRCQSTICRPGASERSAARTAAAAMGAFILFWPAVLLPILEVEKLGHRSTSSVLSGTLELLSHGSWFVGGIVFLTQNRSRWRARRSESSVTGQSGRTPRRMVQEPLC